MAETPQTKAAKLPLLEAVEMVFLNLIEEKPAAIVLKIWENALLSAETTYVIREKPHKIVLVTVLHQMINVEMEYLIPEKLVEIVLRIPDLVNLSVEITVVSSVNLM
jgi:hypothetical protein